MWVAHVGNLGTSTSGCGFAACGCMRLRCGLWDHGMLGAGARKRS